MNKIKIAAISVGGVVVFAHIGLLDMYSTDQSNLKFLRSLLSTFQTELLILHIKLKQLRMVIVLNTRSNDPAILESSKSLTLDLDKKGFFGGRSEQRTEFRRDQFTMDGVRNLGGESTETQGKSAKDIECIVADAGARSQGAMAGSAIDPAGVAVPAVSSIPYVGWLVWWLGINVGSKSRF